MVAISLRGKTDEGHVGLDIIEDRETVDATTGCVDQRDAYALGSAYDSRVQNQDIIDNIQLQIG